MRQHRLKLITLLLLAAILIGLTCAGSGPGSTVAQSIGKLTSQAARVRLTEQDADRTVELHPADRLEVVLEGNPTTGYQWKIDALDVSIIKPIGEPEFKPDSDALGSGGEFTFVFEVITPGQTTLTLIYHRPFEKGVQPLKTFDVTAVVK
ncbi:MAG TPA: protease inhibitor I42 family protein [Anaerolineae bacterium]|nr:protease inhibitor I42 family protein [Anaerolineae bacterium]